MVDREILKRRWKQKWKWELAAQKHKNYLLGRRRGSTSKQFKQFVKDFKKCHICSNPKHQ
tara:strand:- start:24 stop:203 length:180 start_codon:yes stop_codon:yes gene_type:complete